jgi:hypothetical protein
MERAFDYIKRRAKEVGKTIPEVCQELDIPMWRVYQWNRSEPKPVEVFRKISEHLDKLEQK